MIIDENITLKQLWDNDFTIFYDPGTAERFQLTRSKCPKCGSLTVRDRPTNRCLHCDWGN